MTPLVSWAVVGAAVALLALLGRRPLALPGLEALLASRRAPLVAGFVASSTVAWAWGSLREPGIFHDELAYLLQAAIVASGHLAGPAPPLPEFFEQFHVLLSPALAPKYFPGHALALVPGVAAGLPGLMPVLLAGVSAGLLFAVARRVSNGWVALLATLLWLTAPAPLAWRATYFSQSTSTAAWLGAVWALLEWLEKRRTRHLVLVSCLLAWCAITRPLTAVALALPVAGVLLPRLLRMRSLGGLGVAMAGGCLVVALVAPFNAAATGSPFTLPYGVYTRVYLPWDHMGFGFDPTPPLREWTPERAAFTDFFRSTWAEHTLTGLPRDLLARARSSASDMWGTAGVGWDWRAPLVLLALAAIPWGGGAVWFGLGSVVSLLLAYLAHAHGANWTLYYQETQPVLAYLTALGAARLFGRGGDSAGTSTTTLPARAVAPMALASLLVLGLGLKDVAATRDVLHQRSVYQREAARVFARIPDEKAIVFIRYGPSHSPHWSLVQNPPDYERARLWLVHDRGQDNERLTALAPGRTPYLFDEATFTLFRITAPPPPAR